MGKHIGLVKLRRRVEAQGMNAIDGRGSAAKAVAVWRQELLQDLGGEANVSLQKKTLVEMAARTQLFIDHVDSYLLAQGDLINKGKRSLYPVVLQRQSLVDSLSRLLTQLGLNRAEKKVEDLDAWLERRERENEEVVIPAESESEDHEKQLDA